MRLSETHGLVYALKPGDHEGGVDGDSINAKYCSHITFLVDFAALTGNAVLTVKSGATAGTKTTSETFYYRLAKGAQGAANGDVYGDETKATTLTLTAATYENKQLVVEVPISGLTDAQPWITLNLSNAASALNASAVAILSGVRYKEHEMATSI